MPSITRVRIAFHHAAIHKRAGIAFIRVADDVLFGTGLSQGELPLASGGKAAAPATPQAGASHFRADFFGRHLPIGALRRLVATGMHVFTQIPRIDSSALLQDAALLLSVERDVGLASTHTLRCGVAVQQPLDQLALL
jgi:hypothetical protein